MYNKTEFAKICNTTEKEIQKNFSAIGIKMLKQGKFISREKINNEWLYNIIDCEPREGVKDEFLIHKNIRASIIDDNLPNEKWVTCCVCSSLEVSNMGRIREKINHKGRQPYVSKQGYCRVSVDNKKYFLHRIILQSFQPIANYNDMTVDHIDGNRQNNKLENLRWATNDENTRYMLTRRAELNRELTRIIQLHGYDVTLQLLKNIK